jgi:hypothetical protein
MKTIYRLTGPGMMEDYVELKEESLNSIIREMEDIIDDYKMNVVDSIDLNNFSNDDFAIKYEVPDDMYDRLAKRKVTTWGQVDVIADYMGYAEVCDGNKHASWNYRFDSVAEVS